MLQTMSASQYMACHYGKETPEQTQTKTYSKTCIKQPLKIRQNKDLRIDSLVKVMSIAE